jgi:hypothetical protein
MASYSELVYDLMSLKRGQLSDDDIGDKRQFEFWINNTRALLIRQDNNKGRSLTENIIQDLGCVELENADVAECCDMEYGCVIKRTKLLIPRPIELSQQDAILRVATIDKTSKSFTFVPYEQFIFSGNGRFNKYTIFATYRNGRIYLQSKSNTLTLNAMKWINVRGIFEDPRGVGIFIRCDGTTCFSNDSPYPISNWMIEAMKKMILETDIKMMITIPADPSNDASGDPLTQSK